MLNIIVEILLLYTFFFLLIEYRKAHRSGLKGKELWTEIIINKWRVFVSGGTKLMVGVGIVASIHGAYCSGRDFEHESWLNKKLCYIAYDKQKDQEFQKTLKILDHEHEERMQGRQERMQDKQHAHEERMLEKQLSQKSAAPLPGFVMDNTYGWLTHDDCGPYEPLHLGLWVCDDYSAPDLHEGCSYIVSDLPYEWYYDDVSRET